MLHPNFQYYRTFGSGEDFIFFFYYMYGCGSHLGHVTRSIYTILSPFPLRPIIKFGFDWSSGIREDV